MGKIAKGKWSNKQMEQSDIPIFIGIGNPHKTSDALLFCPLQICPLLIFFISPQFTARPVQVLPVCAFFHY